MSGYNTSELARIMLGGFGQGASMASNAAQILDQRQRAEQVQQRYEQEAAYRQQEAMRAQAEKLAQQTALANFAESRGLFAPPVDQTAMGPFEPGMAPPGPGGMDRAMLMGLDPVTARSIVDGSMRQQRDMENAQFEAQLKDRQDRMEITRKAALRSSIIRDMKSEHWDESQINRALIAAGLAELDVPAGVIGQVTGPQDYQRTAGDYRTLLGMPNPAPSGEYGPFQPGAEPAMGQDQADVMARWQMSPTEAARFMPDGKQATVTPEQVDADIARFVQSIEGPTVDLSNPASWQKLDQTGVEIMRLKMRRGEPITDTVLKSMLLDGEDKGVRLRFLQQQAAMLGANLKAMLGNPAAEPEDVQKAERAWSDAQNEWRRAAMGEGSQAGAAPQSAPRGVGQAVPSDADLDAMVPDVFNKLREQLGRAPSREEVDRALRQIVSGG